MSYIPLIPIPYYHLVKDAVKYNFLEATYEPVLNKTLKLDGPSIVVDPDDLSSSKLDIAVAVALDDTPNTDGLVIDDSVEKAEVDEPVMGHSEDAELNDNKDVIPHEIESDIENEPNNNSTDDDANIEQADSELHFSKNDPMSFKTVALSQGFGNEDEPSSVSPARFTSPGETPLELPNYEEMPEAEPITDDDVKKDADKNTPEKDAKLEEQRSAEEDENSKEENEELKKITEKEEKIRKEKEAKLESYKQFVAEQESQVEIDYAGIRVSIEANALPSRMYFIMNALSAIIASYGLVVNSAAVVIGAMLVAMMLGPISGAALAVIDYRIPFLRKSLLTVVAGAAMVVTIGFIIGFLHRDTLLTSEILTRTQPTSMDLMIALAGGTAGAYAMISPHLSVAVVGVAVATALVPPLAASGILFAHGEPSLGFGALLLAITNIIAIQFTNALVLWFSGFRRLMKDDYKTNSFIAFCRRNAVPLVLLAVLGTYLSINFNNIAKKQIIENQVSATINDYFSDKGNALDVTQFVPHEDYQTVRAVIRGETRPSSYDAKYLETQINKRLREKDLKNTLPVRVQLHYLPVVVVNSDPDNVDTISKTDAIILNPRPQQPFK